MKRYDNFMFHFSINANIKPNIKNIQIREIFSLPFYSDLQKTRIQMVDA
jgi:hypothetical protein